jgi:hypothetical protein
MASVSYYGFKSKKKPRFKSERINSPQIRIYATLLGLLMTLIGVYFHKIKIFFEGTSIEQYIFALIVIFVAIAQFIELGIKRYSDLSKLKGFSNQQYFTFWTTFATLIIVIFNLTGYIDSFGWFANGIITAQGLLLILEANR